MAVYAQEATVKEVHDVPAARDGITTSILREYDNPFTLYPYDANYIIYTQTGDLGKEAIVSYDQVGNARRGKAEFQLSLASPLWCGILGPNSVLGASYTQKSWWQSSSSDESSPFHETSYGPQLFLGFATDYNFAGWTLRDVEMGYSHDSNGHSDLVSRSWDHLYTRLMAENGNWLVGVKPWYVVGNTDDNPDIIRHMGYYQPETGYHLGDAVLSAKGQYNQNTGYNSTELSSSYPVTKYVYLHTQAYSGYDESLVGYNLNQVHVGMGVTLDDLL